MVAFSLFSIDFLNGIFKSVTDRVNKYTGNDPVIEKEVKKMGGFGAALVEKTEMRVREQEQRERIEEMLRDGHTPEEIVNFCKYPMSLVLDVEKNLLSLA